MVADIAHHAMKLAQLFEIAALPLVGALVDTFGRHIQSTSLGAFSLSLSYYLLTSSTSPSPALFLALLSLGAAISSSLSSTLFALLSPRTSQAKTFAVLVATKLLAHAIWPFWVQRMLDVDTEEEGRLALVTMALSAAVGMGVVVGVGMWDRYLHGGSGVLGRVRR